jgi:hypothetical protein
MLSDDVGVERYFTYIVTKVVKSTSGIPVASVLPDDRGTADAEKRAVTPRG